MLYVYLCCIYTCFMFCCAWLNSCNKQTYQVEMVCIFVLSEVGGWVCDAMQTGRWMEQKIFPYFQSKHTCNIDPRICPGLCFALCQCTSQYDRHQITPFWTFWSARHISNNDWTFQIFVFGKFAPYFFVKFNIYLWLVIWEIAVKTNWCFTVSGTKGESYYHRAFIVCLFRVFCIKNDGAITGSHCNLDITKVVQMSWFIILYTRYIAVQYNTVLHPVQRLRRWNFGQTSNSGKTPIPRHSGRAMDVFRELFGEKWQRDIGSALYS